MDQTTNKDEKKSEPREYDWLQDRMPAKFYMNWFSWGSPVGLGLFFIEICASIWILHMAGLIR